MSETLEQLARRAEGCGLVLRQAKCPECDRAYLASAETGVLVDWPRKDCETCRGSDSVPDCDPEALLMAVAVWASKSRGCRLVVEQDWEKQSAWCQVETATVDKDAWQDGTPESIARAALLAFIAANGG